MIVAVVIPPDPVLDWATDLKPALRVDSDDEQVYVEGLAAAALSWIGGPDGWLGRAIGEQTLELRTDCWPSGAIELPCGPVRADEEVVITYLDADGAEQTLDAAEYTVLSDGRIIRAPNATWPTLQRVEEAVRIEYLAGEEIVPPAIKQAMLLLVAHWFKNREAVNEGAVVNTMPFGVEALLMPFRRFY